MERFICLFLLFSLKIPWILGSVYSGTENICSLRECSCVSRRVHCACAENSSFQESFKFRDDSRKLQELVVENCSKLILPPQAISAESHLTQILINNVGQVEFQPESLSISRLQMLNISAVDHLVFHQQSFKSYNTDSPTVSVTLSASRQVVIKPRAFASIRRLAVGDVADLQLEPLALKLKVPTVEPTIEIRLTNISTNSLPSSVFSSSFKNILISNSRVDKIQTNAFSGFLMSNISLVNVSVSRIEQAAFSDQSVIEALTVDGCEVSSVAQKAVVAGISRLTLTRSTIQSMSKYGAVNATVANVQIHGNTFKTLGEESLNFMSWNTVAMVDNTIEFLEEGAINAIHSPIDEMSASFRFEGNRIGYANRNSLVTRLPHGVEVRVEGNVFQHNCGCSQDQYVFTLTAHSGLTSPFQDLSMMFLNTSLCKVSDREVSCFPDLPTASYFQSPSSPSPSSSVFCSMQEYEEVLCEVEVAPACTQVSEELHRDADGTENGFYNDFLLLFQVKTTKGILLFLLFCVLSSVIILTICVGSVWVHRLYKRARLVRSNLSGSFQFNSGEEKQILYGSNHTTTSHEDEEPQYAEIADIHPPPATNPTDTGNYSDLEATILTDITTLPKSTTTTLPSIEASTLPFHHNTSCGEKDQLLKLPPLPATIAKDTFSDIMPPASAETGERRNSMRYSMSETSLTDEIMMALRDKLNDPTLYCTVMDAKSPGAVSGGSKEDDLYCAPIYSDPNQVK